MRSSKELRIIIVYLSKNLPRIIVRNAQYRSVKMGVVCILLARCANMSFVGCVSRRIPNIRKVFYERGSICLESTIIKVFFFGCVILHFLTIFGLNSMILGYLVRVLTFLGW